MSSPVEIASAPTRETRPSFVRWLPIWAATTLLILLSCAHPVATPTDEDEFYWIGSAYYFDLGFVQRDWAHRDWQLLPARENPPVAKYVLGLGIHAAGSAIVTPDILGTFYLMFERVPGAWGEGEAQAKRAAVVARMNPSVREQVRGAGRIQLSSDVLLGARAAVIGSALVASFLMLALGARIASGLAGFIASQLLLLHPAMIEAYTHAHADAVAVAFTVGGILAATSLGTELAHGQESRTSRRWLLTLVTGALLGLACGAKMNALPAVLAALASVALSGGSAAWRDRHVVGRILRPGAGVVVAGCVTFVAVNPTLWPDLSSGLRAVVQEHRLTEEIQAAFLAGHLTTISSKLNVVAALVGRHALISLGIALLAGVLLLRGSRTARPIALWFFASALLVTAWIPFARERYILPIVPPSTLVVGIAAAELVTRVRRSRAARGKVELREAIAS